MRAYVWGRGWGGQWAYGKRPKPGRVAVKKQKIGVHFYNSVRAYSPLQQHPSLPPPPPALSTGEAAYTWVGCG